MEATDQGASEPIVNIVGEKVALGPLRRDLVPLFVTWFNDFEVTLGTRRPFSPRTLEAQQAWYERASTDERGSYFAIYDRGTMRPIGTTFLNDIDHANRRAEFGVIIGDKTCWGKGYGTEAARLMLDYGFNLLGLHSLMLRVCGFNQRAIRAYTRAGFHVAGRWREAVRRGGQAYDLVYMDCLATEFESPVLHRFLPRP